jgi:hypothetical protein
MGGKFGPLRVFLFTIPPSVFTPRGNPQLHEAVKDHLESYLNLGCSFDTTASERDQNDDNDRQQELSAYQCEDSLMFLLSYKSHKDRSVPKPLHRISQPQFRNAYEVLRLVLYQDSSADNSACNGADNPSWFRSFVEGTFFHARENYQVHKDETRQHGQSDGWKMADLQHL